MRIDPESQLLVELHGLWREGVNRVALAPDIYNQIKHCLDADNKLRDGLVVLLDESLGPGTIELLA